jgi:hypothetical protein
MAPRASFGGDLNFYVAPNGKEANPGSLSAPFATLQQARDAVRNARKTLPYGKKIRVFLRGGIYYLKNTLELSVQDGGSEDASVTYEAYKNEKPILSGGRFVTGFRHISDAKIRSRLDPSCRDKILVTDLKAQGIYDYGSLSPRGFGRPVNPAGLELFFNDRPMTLARWPNVGWSTISGTPKGQQGGMFTYDGDRPRRWTKCDDVWLHGFWTQDWADSYAKVASIDTSEREIRTEAPHGIYGYTPGCRFYALNILEELDSPGEWYLDRETGKLYFWPPTSIDKGNAVVSTLSSPLISLNGAAFTDFKGLTFDDCRGDAVVIANGMDDRISSCKFENIGNGAIVADGRWISVSNCDISRTGDGGISISGGDRRALSPSHNTIINNRIHDYDRWDYSYFPGISVHGVGCRIAHNLIYNSPHQAISISGNDHLIEYNEIHHVCMDTSDAGAIYTGRNYTDQGNIIRFNYFHDIKFRVKDTKSWPEVMAVYLDDLESGFLVYGNVFSNDSCAILMGGGRDNIIRNNLFLNCDIAISADARGMSWGASWVNGKDSTITGSAAAMNSNQPPYSARYPSLSRYFTDEPGTPKGDSITRNACFGGNWLKMDAWLTKNTDAKYLRVTDNYVDPILSNGLGKDLQPPDGSPAYGRGFTRIPFSKIGLLK